jgi:hypothetical protein
MSRFIKTAGEGEELISELLRRVGKDPELGPQMGKMGLLAAYRCTDPDFTVWLDTSDGRYDVGVGDPPRPPSVMISYEADTAHKAWLNRVNATMAITRGTIKVDGSVTALLRFVPLQAKVAAVYESLLRERGLNELIDV